MNDLANCKVALIDHDGNINKMGQIGDGIFHVDYLYEYIEKNFIGEDELTNLNDEMRRDVFAFHLGNFGYIVIYNDVVDGLEYSMFYFPNEISSKQVNVINELNFDRKKVAICYDPVDFGKFVHFFIIGEDGNQSLKEVFNEYLDVKEIKNYQR